MGVFAVMTSLLVLAVPALIVWGIVAAVRKGSGRAGREGATGSVRHFFQFGVTLGLLLITCYGTVNLASVLVDRTGGQIVTDQGALALPLAFLIVGAPLLTVMVVWLRRAARADQRMGDSTVAVVFMTFALLFAVGNAIGSWAGVLGWMFGRTDTLGGGTAAGAVVWTGTWALLWRGEAALIPQHRRNLHLVLGSLVTAVVSVIGVEMILSTALRVLTGLMDTPIYGDKYAVLLNGLTLVLAAGPLWAWYWLRQAQSAKQSVAWQAYVLIAGVGGGLILAVVAASLTVYQVLVWFIGDHSEPTARAHFASAPDQLSVVIVGLLVWWYHERQLTPGAARTEVVRMYDYLLSAIGLVAGAVGVSTFVVAGIESVTRGSVVVGSSPVNTLLAAATLIVVGAPVWAVTWRRVQQQPAESEHQSPARRIYLYVLFGVGGVATVVCLVIVAYVVLQDVLAGAVSGTTLRDARFALGILASTGLASAYHWRVYRGERDVEVHVARPVKSVTLLGPADENIAQVVADRTGARVRVWVRTDEAAVMWDPNAIVALVDGAAGQDVLVVADPNGAFAIPFRH